MTLPLSSSLSELSNQNEWNVVIVGSGYGASIVAARLAEQGVDDVCMLERGKEWLPGDFPDTFSGVAGNFRLTNSIIPTPPLNRLGLYDYMINREIDVLRGNGLGGTSLINANIAIRPDSEFFEPDFWPDEIKQLVASGDIWNYYARAEQGLAVSPHPRRDRLGKVKALKKRSDQLSDHEFATLNLAVNFDVDGPNASGVEQKPCIDCGDCFSGCNVGAKNTLNFNYLPRARNGGVKIFTRTEVVSIETRNDQRLTVNYRVNEDNQQGPVQSLVANHVVVGAGSLGSTTILLRSREAGLPVSSQLGHHFSGNADFVAIAYNNNDRTDVMGFGNHPNSVRAAVKPGPSIVGGIRYNRSQGFSRRYILEDFSFPRALVDASRRGLPFVAGQDMDQGFLDGLLELQRIGMDLVSWNPEGALNRTMVYLAMGVDSSDGRIELNNDRTKISWPGVPDQQIFQDMNNEIREHARTLGGRFIENFRWTFLGGRNLITVHPLGGCRMAGSTDEGVVNARGQVYDGQGGTHPGLYIVDGAIVPSAVGVNPFLTISALAERIAEQMAASLTGQ